MLLVVLVAMRILSAPGWMPERSEDGRITLSICSAAGLVPATVEVDVGGHSKNDAPAEKAESCPFGISVQTAMLPEAPSLALPSDMVLPPVQSALTTLNLGIRTALPPSTGPPLLA